MIESILSLFKLLELQGIFKQLTNLPIKQHGHRADALGNHIYVMGGATTETVVHNRLFRYTPSLDQWVELTPAPFKVTHHQSCVYQGKLYYQGGYHEDFSLSNKLFAYTPETDSWEILNDGPSVMQGVLVPYQDKLYLIMGAYQPAFDYRNEIHVYDLNTKQWTMLPDPGWGPAGRGYIGTYQEGRYVYVTGGFSIEGGFYNDCWVYDLDYHTWDSLPNLPQDLYSHGLIQHGSYLYTAGGYDGDSVRQMYRYHLEKMYWEPFVVAPYGNHTTQFVKLGNKGYLIAGREQGSYDQGDDQVWEVI